MSGTVFIGPRLRRLRRDLGLTQARMAEGLGVSASYIALIERNQRPLTAELLLKLAEVYRVDIAQFAGDGGEELNAGLEEALKDPLLNDLDVPVSDLHDLAVSQPQMAEALIRLHRAYLEGQLALADQGSREAAPTALSEVRAFLSARHNFFPSLDDRAERLSVKINEVGGFNIYMERQHSFAVRRLSPEIMQGAVRRLDLHSRELVLDDSLDRAGSTFQVALQIAYLELGDIIEAAMSEAQFTNEGSARLCRRALANYGAGAMVLPYQAFFREAERTGYDIEALARHFGTSFEQTAHRLTTLQKPSYRGIPFFFIRVDAAGNVSKRLDGGGFPFARHGGSCPLWSLHDTFRKPRELHTEIIELPDGERFFSIARTVTAGGGGWSLPRVTRAIALGCRIEEAHRLIYAKGIDLEKGRAALIGVTCRLCQRASCAARAEPPIGRQLLADDYRRLTVPFSFTES